jgi:hypothetical protein
MTRSTRKILTLDLDPRSRHVNSQCHHHRLARHVYDGCGDPNWLESLPGRNSSPAQSSGYRNRTQTLARARRTSIGSKAQDSRMPLPLAGTRSLPAARNNFDISLLKTVQIRERASLEFRFEAQNALNHPQFVQVPQRDIVNTPPSFPEPRFHGWRDPQHVAPGEIAVLNNRE